MDAKKEKITDHPFTPSLSYPEGEGCAYIIQGAIWTASDPHRCRKPESEHTETLRENPKQDT
jgi:hypothetical protein